MVHITTDLSEKLRVPLESYMNCSIVERDGDIRSCNMENVLGSFYTIEELPQYCYSIYSLWGKPDKKRETIRRGSIMRFHFSLNTTLRPPPTNIEKDTPLEYIYIPKHNLPISPSIQMSIHSPYFLPTPYIDGFNYQTGRAYEVGLTMREKHLLPFPYQTNCTDYMKTWRARGGMGPIDQLSIIQECRLNKTYEERGCIPTTLDYPHHYNICRTCSQTLENCTGVDIQTHGCEKLSNIYNQPCDSINYNTMKEDKMITEYDQINTPYLRQPEGVRRRFLEYDCKDFKMWQPKCANIEIDIVFDRFEISNLTYKPKFESLEIFSCIGGYMGMYLGISIIAMYDFFIHIVKLIIAYLFKKHKKRKLTPSKNNLDFYGDTYEKTIKLYDSKKYQYW